MVKIAKMLLKIAGIVISTLIGLIIVYSLIICNPQFLFKNKVNNANLLLYSDESISNNMKNILEDVQTRISRSKIYNSKHTYKVFICNDINKYRFFAPTQYKQTGGFTLPYLCSNSFIRKSDIGDNCIINLNGNKVEGPRNLTYVITHEITHCITGEKLGTIAELKLPLWINDGYSEYIAQTEFDFSKTLERLKNGMLEEGPGFRSYYYDRYHLFVSYLLDVKKVSTEDLLSGRYKQSEVENELKDYIEKGGSW